MKVVGCQPRAAIRNLLNTLVIDEVYTEDYKLTAFGNWIAGLDKFIPEWDIRKELAGYRYENR